MLLLQSMLTALLLISSVQTDWFDDLVDGLHDKIVSGANYIKHKAAPTIRETFDEAKNKLKDPETHRQLRQWIKEKAVPAVQAKVNALVTFLKKEVVPQLKDIKRAYDAAVDDDSIVNNTKKKQQ